MRGFEPPASSSRTTCATGLRYIPIPNLGVLKFLTTKIQIPNNIPQIKMENTRYKPYINYLIL